jgi:acetylglutamate kinase
MLTRIREGLVKTRTDYKNKVHRDLASANIKLASVVSDVFGKSGMHCLIGKLNGQDIDEIIETIPSGRVRKKADEIREAISTNFNQVQILSIKICLSLIESINQKIEEVDREIKSLTQNKMNNFIL